MGLSQKIDEIRKKPEHIRMRYVFASVLIAMIFIFLIWVFSVRESFKELKIETKNENQDSSKDFMLKTQNETKDKDITDLAK